MPTEIVKYVDPDGGVLADYTSLQAAITAEKAIRSDLVARDEQLILDCRSSAGSPDTTTVSVSGFVTDATRYLVIKGDNAAGYWDTNKYRLIAGGSNVAISNDIAYLHITNMQIETTIGATFLYGIYSESNNLLLSVSNSMFRFSGSVTNKANVALNLRNANAIYLIKNCIFYDFLSTSVVAGGIYGRSGTILALNNTFYNCKTGIEQTASNISAKNNITQDCTDGFKGTFLISSDYNLSDLSGDAPGANSLNSTTVNFADAANGDFRLLAGSPGIDQGVDLSADPSYPFNTAIDGTVRPQGAAWDIGAFELIQQTFNPAWAKHSNQIIRAI